MHKKKGFEYGYINAGVGFFKASVYLTKEKVKMGEAVPKDAILLPPNTYAKVKLKAA
jgi:hypothetical protein